MSRLGVPPMKRWERVAAYLCNELEVSKPSLSPDAYPVLDSYLTGFEDGLKRAQHIVRGATRRAMILAATPEPQS